MTKNEYKINTELINAILEEEFKGIYLAPNGRFFEAYNDAIDCRVDTNDFFFNCIDWAFNQGYILRSWVGTDIINLYNTKDKIGFCKIGIGQKFSAKSQQQAVFDACQWILENKGSK